MTSVSHGHFIGDFHFGQLSDGVDASQLHFFRNRGRANIKRPTENKREAEHVIDLVRIIRTTGSDDGVRTHLTGFFRHDFRCGVGQREDQRVFIHRWQPLGFQCTGGRQTEEHISADQRIFQCASVGLLGILGFGRLHVFFTADVDNAFGVADGNVFTLDTDFAPKIQTSDGGSTGTRHHHADFGDILLDDLEAVDQCRSGNNRGAMLIVVEDRDLHPLLEFALDVKTLRRFDVFQIDAAERGL